MKSVSLFSLILCLSVAYNFGFFSAIDSSMFTLMGTDDYISSFVIWAIPSFVAFFIGVVLSFLTHKSESIKQAEKEKVLRLIPWRKWQWGKVLVGIVGAGLIYYGIIPQKNSADLWVSQGLLLIIFWNGTKELILSNEELFDKFDLLSVALIELGPVLLIVAGVSGYYQGSKALEQENFYYDLYLKNGDIITYAPIRHLSSGILFVSPDMENTSAKLSNTVSYVPWGNVLRTERNWAKKAP